MSTSASVSLAEVSPLIIVGLSREIFKELHLTFLVFERIVGHRGSRNAETDDRQDGKSQDRCRTGKLHSHWHIFPYPLYYCFELPDGGATVAGTSILYHVIARCIALFSEPVTSCRCILHSSLEGVKFWRTTGCLQGKDRRRGPRLDHWNSVFLAHSSRR